MDDDYTRKAKVVRVVDADTIDCEIALGFGVSTHQRLRLARIDAWEVRGEEREKGLAASAYVKDLFKDIEYIVVQTTKAKGKYGRYIAEIYIPDMDYTNLNDLLVLEGHATKYEE